MSNIAITRIHKDVLFGTYVSSGTYIKCIISKKKESSIDTYLLRTLYVCSLVNIYVQWNIGIQKMKKVTGERV